MTTTAVLTTHNSEGDPFYHLIQHGYTYSVATTRQILRGRIADMTSREYRALLALRDCPEAPIHAITARRLTELELIDGGALTELGRALIWVGEGQ